MNRKTIQEIEQSMEGKPLPEMLKLSEQVYRAYCAAVGRGDTMVLPAANRLRDQIHRARKVLGLQP